MKIVQIKKIKIQLFEKFSIKKKMPTHNNRERAHDIKIESTRMLIVGPPFPGKTYPQLKILKSGTDWIIFITPKSSERYFIGSLHRAVTQMEKLEKEENMNEVL